MFTIFSNKGYSVNLADGLPEIFILGGRDWCTKNIGCIAIQQRNIQSIKVTTIRQG